VRAAITKVRAAPLFYETSGGKNQCQINVILIYFQCGIDALNKLKWQIQQVDLEQGTVENQRRNST
tara:strand:+ start:721 stop:918 length:198 start_codon:yes stop_codon:yes gene_type:complete